MVRRVPTMGTYLEYAPNFKLLHHAKLEAKIGEEDFLGHARALTRGRSVGALVERGRGDTAGRRSTVRAAIYARMSTDKQSAVSPAKQKGALRCVKWAHVFGCVGLFAGWTAGCTGDHWDQIHMEHPRSAPPQNRAKEVEAADFERVVAIVSDVASQFGFVRVDPNSENAYFQRDSHPRMMLNVIRSAPGVGLYIAILDKGHSKETSMAAKVRQTLQPRLESAFPEYTFRFEERNEEILPRDL
jgi:hypothetical protein